MLDFSKVEAGRLELEEIPFRIDELMKTLATIISAGTRDKTIEVLFEIAPETPPSLVGDPLRLQQVLMNLTSNAIKFTERGEVVLSVAPALITDTTVDLTFAVRDTGIGIGPDEFRHIFDAFSQADSGTSRRYGGSGLGLAISRRLVALMGGEIAIESEPGRGSTFRFTARFGRGPAVAPLLAPPDLARPLRLLVADDHPTARAVLAAMIEPFGWRPEVAASGEEAIAALDRSQAAGEPFDLMMLDWQMPGVGGREVLRHARERCGPDGLPAIVVASASEHDRVRREAGDDPAVKAILIKPVTPSVLFDAVVRACAGPAGAAEPPAPAAATPLAGLSLLLVEDNKINQMIARRILETAGAAVEVAGGGAEAVAILGGEGVGFDAVLMDIQMPGLDGYETTRIIRERLGRALPIIAMTANALPADRERCLAAGMDDHVSKPLDIERLHATILLWTRKPGPAEALPAGAGAGALPELPELDLRTGLRRVSGDLDLLKEIMADFVVQHADAAAALARALAAGDHAAIARIAHDLKTLAANIGAMPLSEAAAALQTAARRDPGQAAPRVEEVIRRLEVTIRSASACLDGLL